MTIRALQFGDVVTARFPEQNPQGREQQGIRPAIVVGFPARLGVLRFDLVIVVPLTTNRGQDWAIASPQLYPVFPSGVTGLRSSSIALLDQVRAIDVRRILNYRGSLTTEQFAPILDKLQQMINA